MPSFGQKHAADHQVLMKQKEAQAIRRLIQEKDAQDRGMGREQLGQSGSLPPSQFQKAATRPLQLYHCKHVGTETEDTI